MKQSDPQRLLVQAVGGLVGRLGSQDAAGLIVFGGQARAAFPLTVLASEEKRQALLAEITQLRYADPRTNMAAGVERGLYEIRQHGRAQQARQVLVFLTDGIMDAGSASKDAEMRDWLRTRLLPEVRELGIRFFSIALTEQADYALIQEFAAATKGDYFRALSGAEIGPIFERIHARITAPAPRPSSAPPTPPPAAGPSPSAPSPGSWLGLWLGLAALLCLAAILAAVLLRQKRLPSGGGAATHASGGVQKTLLAARMSGGEAHALAYLSDTRTGKPTPLIIPVMRIGRAADSDLVLSEPQVSSHHAEIELRQGRFYLRDLRSTNGTWVNTQRVEGETILRPGDVVRFDELAYTFFCPDTRTEGVKGTMIRDAGAATMLREPPPEPPPEPSPKPSPEPPRPPAHPRGGSGTMAETALLDTIDDRTGPQNCPFHPNFEATERCDRCGRLWCALCNPPLAGERVCRTCRETAKGATGRPDGPPGRSPGYL